MEKADDRKTRPMRVRRGAGAARRTQSGEQASPRRPSPASALGVTTEVFRPLPWLSFPFQIFLSHFTGEEQQIIFL